MIQGLYEITKQSDSMTLPEKIKHHRKLRGWAQAELAKRLGVHTNHVCRLEGGRFQPSIELLKKLTQEFEVSADYLLNDQEEQMAPLQAEDQAVAERVRLINTLEPRERDSLLNILDALLTKKKVFDMVARETQPIAH
ncbi:MAG: helix-turn-helix transcriptional regulator [Acidobacteria bacterium]|nr:helix-turn-helix transcriptional regulator [Acidobacteriota bacterium]